MSRSSKCLIVLILGSVLLTGCLDWLSQDFHLARSRDGKDLYVLIMYHGLFANKDEVKAKAQLREVWERGEQFAINDNFVGVQRLGHWRDILKELEDRQPDEKAPAVEAFLRHLIANIRVRNGGLGLGRDGRLDGWQIVQWRDVDEGLRLANAAINESIANSDLQLEDFPLTDVAWIVKAGTGGYQWITLNGAAVEVRFPVNPSEKSKFKEGFYRELLQSAKSTSVTTATLESTIRALSDNSISLIEKFDEFHLVLGVPENPANQIALPTNTEKLAVHSNTLVTYAETLPVWRGTIDPGVPEKNFRRDPEAAWAALPDITKPQE